MKLLTSIESMNVIRQPVVLAAGTLDGVHKGHREVLETAVAKARYQSAESWLMTFHPHPMDVLAPHRKPPLLTTQDEKLQRIAEVGFTGCLEIPFTKEFSQWEPRAFIEHLREYIPGLQEIVVGQNWTFGRKAEGTVDRLREWAGEMDFKVTMVSPILWKGETISSSRIRKAINEGDLEDAEHMLGRPYEIKGRVVHGRQVGRQLGYPTANLQMPERLVHPRPGIYAVLVRMDGELRDGAAYYGRRPTFEDDTHELTLEVYLLDWEGDLYDRDIEVRFVKFLREDRRFDGEVQLKEQIGKDIAQARRVLKRRRRFVPEYEI